ncbi:MAG: hypothetical protein LBG98_01310 [Puniceicoccales bacterium]|nr:hypothetical protein [Puniceicoccales bacterium]
MKAPALHFSLPQRRQTESSRAWEFCRCPRARRCCQKRSTKGKERKERWKWKRGHIGDLFLHSISALSLFLLPDFDGTL